MIMPTLPECYRLLGVSPKADIAEIKRRFRLLALKFHPDRNPRNPEAAARFREVAEAYGAICNRRPRQPAPPKDRPEQKSNGTRQESVCSGEPGGIFRLRRFFADFCQFWRTRFPL